MGDSAQTLIGSFLDRQGFFLLDGGLATELESRGHVLDTPLWSAQLLLNHANAIAEVHRSYLESGADCIISASYQASIDGFESLGLDRAEAERLILLSVEVALDSRDLFARRVPGRPQPLVAASVGPYGAFLADGSEYRGDYVASDDDLRTFHEERWFLLAESAADLLACETMPSLREAEILRDLLHQTPGRSAWFSFSCRDGKHINDGTPIRDCAAMFEGDPQVIAIGVNCSDPAFVSSLIREVLRGAPSPEVVVYPNSGESYDGARRNWTGTSDSPGPESDAVEWLSRGARLLGGCCRTSPDHIRRMKKRLLAAATPAQVDPA